jgi:hypothetical protein
MNDKKELVLTACMINETSGLAATGIPLHLVLANELVLVWPEIATLRKDVGDKLVAVPGAVQHEVLENVVVEGRRCSQYRRPNHWNGVVIYADKVDGSNRGSAHDTSNFSS